MRPINPANISERVLLNSGRGWDFTKFLTFARASEDVIINPVTGEVRLFAAGVPAIINIGGRKYLSSENSRQCLDTYNQALDNADWNKTSAGDTLTPTTDPLGGNTAYNFVPSTANGTHLIWQSKVGRTQALCAKANGYNYVYIRYGTAAGDYGNIFCNLTTGVLNEVVTDGVSKLLYSRSQALVWGGYYFEITISANSNYCEYGVCNTNSNYSFAGDGVSGAILWLPQANTNTEYCGSLIRTVASAVTRSADNGYIAAASVPTALKDKITARARFRFAGTQTADVRTLLEFVDTTQNIKCYYDGADKKVKIAGTAKNIDSGTALEFIAINNGIAYWTDYTTGTVRTINLTTGVAATIKIANQPVPISANDTYVYYGEYANQKIYRINKDGSGATELASGVATMQQSAINATHLFVASMTPGKIVSLRLADNVLTDEVTGLTNPWGVAVDSTNLYWSANGKISYRPLAGGATVDLVTGLTNVRGIAVDSARIYWNLAAGSVYSAPLATGTPATLITTATTPNGIAIDSYRAIFTNGTTISSIFKAPFSSAATTHSALQEVSAALDRVAGTMTLAGFTTGNGITTGTAWNRTDGALYVGRAVADSVNEDGFVNIS